MKILHLGCGQSKIEGAVGVDWQKFDGVDIVHDLNQFPYPFPGQEFDLVVAEHVLEHLEDLVKVVEEIHRLLKPNGRVEIISPHFSSADTFTDITHRHFLTSRSFDYFCPESDLYKYGYSKIAKFRILKKELGPRPWPLILKPLGFLINRFPVFYERRLAFLFPVGAIYVELEKI